MREILFKAKRLDTGEWIEGYYWTNLVDNHFIRIAQDKTGQFTIDDYEIDPDTLCQFTGLTDKDGNKIWENDIVDVSDCAFITDCLNIFKLKLNTYLLVKHNDTSSGFDPFVANDADGLFFYNAKKVKVIGNKIDNLELLKGDN